MRERVSHLPVRHHFSIPRLDATAQHPIISQSVALMIPNVGHADWASTFLKVWLAIES